MYNHAFKTRHITFTIPIYSAAIRSINFVPDVSPMKKQRIHAPIQRVCSSSLAPKLYLQVRQQLQLVQTSDKTQTVTPGNYFCLPPRLGCTNWNPSLSTMGPCLGADSL